MLALFDDTAPKFQIQIVIASEVIALFLSIVVNRPGMLRSRLIRSSNITAHLLLDCLPFTVRRSNLVHSLRYSALDFQRASSPLERNLSNDPTGPFWSIIVSKMHGTASRRVSKSDLGFGARECSKIEKFSSRLEILAPPLLSYLTHWNNKLANSMLSWMLSE